MHRAGGGGGEGLRGDHSQRFQCTYKEEKKSSKSYIIFVGWSQQ